MLFRMNSTENMVHKNSSASAARRANCDFILIKNFASSQSRFALSSETLAAVAFIRRNMNKLSVCGLTA